MEPVFLLHSVTPKPNTLYGVTRRTAPGFVGNYIHDPSTVSWYHKKQRPSKQARQKHRAAAKNSTVHDERQSSRPHSESGYETVGEQQNTSKNKPLREKVDDQETSLSAAASSNTVLKRLLKDLNRCNVFITRSQRALYQNCLDGERELKQIFSLVREHLKARENDLLNELNSTRKTAASILKCRKATLSYLKDAVTTNSKLDEAQVAELVEQMKLFVADRKVDEQIGALTRFHSDMDNILPHIMGFGQVKNVRHLYTEWEENPDKMILRNKSSITFLPLPLPLPSIIKPDLEDLDHKAEPTVDPKSDPKVDLKAKIDSDNDDVVTHVDSGFISVPESGGSGLDNDITSPTHDNTFARYECSTNPSSQRFREDVSTNPSSHRFREDVSTNRFREDVTEGERLARKYSPEQLKDIQARVKDSLKSQGVYLYDPLTGAGPPKPLESAGYPQRGKEGATTRQTRGAWRTKEDGNRDATRKKKTPTQLRRERKKRQKERERRQKELEKTAGVSEESDVQTPISQSPPSQETMTPSPPPPSPPYSELAPALPTQLLEHGDTLTLMERPLNPPPLCILSHVHAVERLASLAAKAIL